MNFLNIQYKYETINQCKVIYTFYIDQVEIFICKTAIVSTMGRFYQIDCFYVCILYLPPSLFVPLATWYVSPSILSSRPIYFYIVVVGRCRSSEKGRMGHRSNRKSECDRSRIIMVTLYQSDIILIFS